MTEENVQSGLEADGVKDVSGVVQDLIGNVVSNLTNNDKPRTVGTEPPEPRLFFPNGIELIDVTVSVGPVSVHAGVAGAKGVSPKTALEFEQQSNGSVASSAIKKNGSVGDHDITIGDDGIGNPGFEIVWHNRSTLHDLGVAFDAGDGCPLDDASDCVEFVVSKNGGEHTTTVAKGATKKPYGYSIYSIIGGIGPSRRQSVTSGNSKVTIQ